MSISATCPCGKEYRIKEELAGKKIRCKDCNKVFNVPLHDASDEAEPDEFDALLKLGRAQEERQPTLPPKVKQRPKVKKRDVEPDEPPPRKQVAEGWFGSTSGGVGGGILMIVIALVWFFVGLAAGRIFFYPPILLIVGIVSVIKGLVSR